MSEPDAPPPAPTPPPPKTPYQGPFKRRALEKAQADARAAAEADGEPAPRSPWLSATRFYFIGMIAALLVTGFYVSKLMITPEMVLQSAADAPDAGPKPTPVVRAYCIPAAGGAPVPVEPRPFCTEARPPSCKDGDTLQLTYGSGGAGATHVHAAILGGDFQPIVVAPNEAVRAAAKDAPLGQWKVTSQSPRRHVAVVSLFAKAPLQPGDVAPFFDAWRAGVRLLERPPEMPAGLREKQAELVAFLVCVGR